jgi:hypothetical protein
VTNNHAARDAEILRSYKTIGDADVLSKKFGVSKVTVYKIIHAARLAGEISHASEYAQSVMQSGEVVFALPAKTLQTIVGADAIVNALESAIAASGSDCNVLIAIAVIPSAEVGSKPLENPRMLAARIAAKSARLQLKTGAA